MNSGLKIEEITAMEWEKLRDLYLKLLKINPDAFADEYDEIASRGEKDWKESLEKRGATFVAIINDEFVGMGRINFYEELPGVAVLHKLGVLPPFRGNGIAKELVKIREKWAKSQEAKKLRLYIMEGKKKTVEFSEKNGYHFVENVLEGLQRKDGSRDGFIIMEKELS